MAQLDPLPVRKIDRRKIAVARHITTAMVTTVIAIEISTRTMPAPPVTARTGMSIGAAKGCSPAP
jgi:hypothetical protein